MAGKAQHTDDARELEAMDENASMGEVRRNSGAASNPAPGAESNLSDAAAQVPSAIGEPCTAANQYRQTADAHVQTLKAFWKNFLVSGLFVVAAIVIIFACLAWFLNNSQVKATGASVSAVGVEYSITSEGADKGYYERNDGKGGIDLGGLDAADAMLVAEGSNLNNWTKGELGPGSYGTLTFTVVPYSDNLGDIQVHIGRCVKTRQGETINADGASDIKTLLSGHILFFKEKSNGYYGSPVLDDTVLIDSANFGGSAKKPVTVTLYWVWPEHFQNYVLTGSVNYEQNLFSDTDAKGYTDLLAAIKSDETWSRFFKARPTVAPENIKADMSTSDLQACSSAYNEADEELGKAVEYVQIRFTASKADDSNNAN